MTAGSLGSPSLASLFESYELLKNTGLLSTVESYLKVVKGDLFNSILDNIRYVSKWKITSLGYKYPYLGRLAFKEEPAGKLRVFAMVDVITQSLLKPLHDSMLSLFRLIPNDATLDQSKSFDRAVKLSLKYNQSFGYDLSSATDRLPISSQKALLNNLYGIGDY